MYVLGRKSIPWLILSFKNFLALPALFDIMYDFNISFFIYPKNPMTTFMGLSLQINLARIHNRMIWIAFPYALFYGAPRIFQKISNLMSYRSCIFIKFIAMY